MFEMDTSTPVLVTGAPGFVAGWLVKGLLDAGVTVHAAVRDPEYTGKRAPRRPCRDFARHDHPVCVMAVAVPDPTVPEHRVPGEREDLGGPRRWRTSINGSSRARSCVGCRYGDPWGLARHGRDDLGQGQALVRGIAQFLVAARAQPVARKAPASPAPTTHLGSGMMVSLATGTRSISRAMNLYGSYGA